MKALNESLHKTLKDRIMVAQKDGKGVAENKGEEKTQKERKKKIF